MDRTLVHTLPFVLIRGVLWITSDIVALEPQDRRRSSQMWSLGSTNWHSIVSFLTKQSLPQMSSVTDTNHTSFKQIDDTVFIAFLGASDTELISLYTEAAQAFHESFAFGLSVAPSLAASENIEPPAVVSYQNTNDHSSALTGAFDILSLQDFIHSSSTPFIGQLTRRSMDNYLSLRKPILYIFLPRHPPSLNSTSNDDLLRALGSTARVYGPYVSFVHIDAVDYAHMAPALELRPNIWPAVVMHDVVRDRVWVYPQDDEVEAGKVEALVLGVLKGEIEPTPPGAGRETIEENGEGGALAHDEL